MLPVSVSCPVGQDGGGSTMLTEQKLEGKQMLSLQSRRPKSIVIMHIKIAEVRGAGLK